MTLYIIFFLLFNFVSYKFLRNFTGNKRRILAFASIQLIVIFLLTKIYNLAFENPLIPGLSFFILSLFSWAITCLIAIKKQTNIFSFKEPELFLFLLITIFQVAMLLSGAVYVLK